MSYSPAIFELSGTELDAVSGGGHGHGHGRPDFVAVSVIVNSTFTIGNTTATATDGTAEAEGGIDGAVVIGAGNFVVAS
jgi:hypothetical protein